MDNPYSALLQSSVDDPVFVDKTLTLMEKNLREISLLALQDWAALGLVSQHLFKPLAALHRPAWGAWNGLFSALLNARSDNTQGKRNKAERKKVEGAKVLNHLHALLGENIKNEETQKWLTPLYNILTKQKPPRHVSLQTLLSAPIAERNYIAHFKPSQPDYWKTLAEVLRPMVQWLSQQHTLITYCDNLAHAKPWFLESDEGLFTYNGIHGKQVSYVGADGTKKSKSNLTAGVLDAFQTLMGKTKLEKKQFYTFLKKLAPDDFKGVLMADYLVGEPKGEGAHGVIHKAIHLKTGRQVAIKLLKDDIAADSEIQARFGQEAKLLSQLDHPHIVTIYGYGHADWLTSKDISLANEAWYKTFAKSNREKIYIAMEWIEGQTLDEYYAQNRKDDAVEFDQLTGWFLQACQAVEYLHQFSYIHRDIKPSNLLVDDKNNIKLIDFGIARSLKPQSAIMTQDPNAQLGSPAYMSPEQMRADYAETEIGTAVDVYGLSAVFYELYTQKRLFNHDTETAETITAIKRNGKDRPRAPRNCNKKIPWQLNTILSSGLENEIDDRYKTIMALQRDVLHFQRNEPIEHKPPHLLRRLQLGYRRNTLIANATLVVVALSTVFIINTLIQKNKIRQERDRAIALINYMNFDLRDKLKPIGKLDIMKGVQQRINQFFDSIELNSNDKTELYQKAVGLGQNANTLFSQGNIEQAETLYLQAHQLHKTLSQNDPNNVQWKNGLSVSLNNIGDLYQSKGEADKVLKAYQASLEIDKRLSESDPSNVQWQLDLSVSLNKVGGIYQSKGKTDKGLKAYQKSLNIRKSLSESDPSNVQWQRDLATSYSYMGKLYQSKGETDKTLKAYQASLNIRKRLSKNDPSNVQWQRNLSVSLNKIAELYQSKSEAAKALKAYQASLDIVKKLSESDPSNVQWQGDLMASYSYTGKLYQSKGQTDKALKAYQKSLEIIKNLSENDPSNAQWQRDFSVSLNNIGELYQLKGEVDNAQKAYQKSYDISKRLSKSNPSNVQWQRDLSVSLNKIGVIYQWKGEINKAQKAYQDSLDIRRELNKNDPNNVQSQRDLSTSLDNIGGIYQLKNEVDKAQKAYQDSLDLRKNLSKSDPTNMQWQRDLSVSYDKVGNIYQRKNETDNALKAYEDSLSIRKSLSKSDPSNMQWQRDLSAGLDNIGNIYQSKNESDKAQKVYQDSLNIRKILSKNDPSNMLWQRDLSVSLDNVGRLYQLKGEAKKAQKAYQDSFKIAKILSESDPSNAEWQRDLMVSYVKLSKVQPNEAKKYLQKALNVLQTLKQKNRLAPIDEGIIKKLKNALRNTSNAP